MNSRSPVRTSGPRFASANPTASKPKASARSRIASRMGSAIRLSASSPIGSHARIGKPQPGGGLAGLVENIDRDAATRVPISADPQPFRGQHFDQLARDRHGAVFVKGGVVAKRAEV